MISSISPTIEKVGGGTLSAGGAVSSAFAAKAIFVIGVGAHALPIIGTIIGVAMMALGAYMIYHACQRENISIEKPEPDLEAPKEIQIEEIEKEPAKEITITPPVQVEEVTTPVEVQVEENPTPVEIVEEPQPLALSNSDKLLTASNVVQWGLTGAAFAGVAPAVLGPLGFVAGLGSEIASYNMLPSNASWFRKAASFPFVTKTILGMNPLVRGISRVVSLYNLVQNSGSKLVNAWKTGGIKAGAVHLFNLASGVAFAADSAGLIHLSPKPEDPDKPFEFVDPCKPDCNPEMDSSCPQPNSKDISVTVGTAYDNGGDKQRDAYAVLIDQDDAKYAERWGLNHTVIKDLKLLENKCLNPVSNKRENCSSYWLKIPAILKWLKEPRDCKFREEWRILKDDDMVFTNHQIDPYQAIKDLRPNDESVILANDPNNWPSWYFPPPHDPKIAINGGLWFVRKDAAATEFMNKVWETRDIVHKRFDPNCRTLGLCFNQDALHEQQGTVAVLRDNPRFLDGKVAVVPARDDTSTTRAHLALNTYHGHENSCYTRIRDAWPSQPFQHHLEKWNPKAMWRRRDWLGQVAAIPVWGKQLPIDENDQCKDDPAIPATTVRQNKIQEMLDQAVR